MITKVQPPLIRSATLSGSDYASSNMNSLKKECFVVMFAVNCKKYQFASSPIKPSALDRNRAQRGFVCQAISTAHSPESCLQRKFHFLGIREKIVYL